MRKTQLKSHTIAAGCFIASLATLAVTPPAGASLIAYEGFNYTAGSSLAGQSGGGSTGFVSEWASPFGGDVTLEAGSLSFGALDTTGGKVYVSPTSGTTTAPRSLSSPISSGVTYVSVLAQFEAGTRQFGLALHESGTERLLIGKQGGQTDWSIGAGGGFGVAGTGITATNTPTLLVVRIEWDESGDEDIRLWVNPTPGSSEPALASADAVKIGERGGFNGIRVAAGFNSGSQITATGWIDEVRIGTTWADVTPVPEPGSVGLFSVASLLWLKRRRA